MSATTMAALPARTRTLFPGVIACAVVAAAATFLAEHYGAPVMLFALLLGMAMNFLAATARASPGIDFTGRTVLRVGVALLGLRITAGAGRGARLVPAAAGGASSVVLTIGLSMLAARLLGFRSLFGLLTGGATAICGASAALALAAALPAHPLKERATLFTVIGVSALSTLAMIVYPIIARALGLDAAAGGRVPRRDDPRRRAGGRRGLRHVAGDRRRRHARQADARGDAAAGHRRRGHDHAAHAAAAPRPSGRRDAGRGRRCCRGSSSPLPCWSQSTASAGCRGACIGLGNDASRWCLVAAIAGIGMKTQLRELATVGIKPVLLMIGETVFLAVLVLLLLRWAA